MKKHKQSIIFLSLLAVGLATYTNSYSQQIDEPVDSIRAPFSSEVTYSAVIQLETISPTTGKPILIAGSAKTILFNFITDSVLLVDLNGSKTLAKDISGVRVTFTATPKVASGWEQVAPWGLRKAFNSPLTLPAGKFLGCRYDMPSQKFTVESIAATTWSLLAQVVSVTFGEPVKQAKITWTPVKGNIKCVVGVKAADIPPPLVVVAVPPVPPVPPVTPPVVIPPVPPTPIPVPVTPPVLTESPDGSSIPPLTQIVTSTGDIWTQQGTHPLINGIESGGSGSFQILYKNKIIYMHQAPNNWWFWRGSWAPASAP